MATTEPTEVDAPDTTGNEPLTRFANVLGATLVGMAATGLLLWLLAGGLQLGGGGIFYLVAFLVATGLGYVAIKQATETLPALRIGIIVAGLGAIGLVSLNWRRFGFEDPFVAPAIFAIFVMMAYFFIPGGKTAEPEKSFKEEMEERLAESEVGDEPLAAANGATASVTLYRLSKMMGMQVDYYISCDGEPVAKIANGCWETVKIPAGRRELTLTDEYGTGSTAPISLDLKPDEKVFVDCTFRSLWSGVAFKRVAPAEAESDMEGLSPAPGAVSSDYGHQPGA